MKTALSLVLLTLFIGGSIYLFLQKPAPKKYLDLIVEAEPLDIKKGPTKVLFVGDIMLDRSIRRVIDEKGFDYILNDVRSIFTDKNLIIGNLEGTITENDSIAVINNKILHFTFATSTAADLRRVGFDGVSLANNHTLDFYQAGFDETKDNLNKAGIFSYGHPLNNQNLSYIKVIDDKRFCFLGYHSLYNASTTNVINEIYRIRPNCDYLTVFSHWGIEYEDIESQDQRYQAHAFVDAGADLVIGAHPHVIQPIEIYNNKAIFYSLGNFIFDQDFSLKTRQGIAVELSLDDKNQVFKIIPIEMYKGKLYFPELESFQPRINILASELSSDLKKGIESNLLLNLNK